MRNIKAAFLRERVQSFVVNADDFTSSRPDSHPNWGLDIERWLLILLFLAFLGLPGLSRAASDLSITAGATSGGAFDGANPNILTATATPAIANNATIQTLLVGGTSVTINTASSANGNGDLTVGAAIIKTSGSSATLTLNVVRDLVLSGSISASSSGTLSLALSAGGSISSTQPISSNGGTIVINCANLFTLGSSLSAGPSGLVQVQTGCLQSASSYTPTITGSSVEIASTAALQISGSVSGALSVSGTLSPGPAAGSLRVIGPVTLQETATTIFHIGGTSQSSSYDYVNCSGTVTLAGALQLSVINGFENTIAGNNSFTVISGSSINGTFAGLPDGARINLPNDLGSVKINYTATAVTLSDWRPIIVELAWDPGTADAGTLALSYTSLRAGRYYFHIYTQSTDIGAWRSALSVAVGEADLYLSKGTIPTVSSNQFASNRAGSDGFVLRSDQFAAGQDWYILVNVTTPGSQWSLLSGRPYLQDLGTLGFEDANSNGTYDIGEKALPSGSGLVSIKPEGMRFFKATVPTGTPAWSLWLNGDTRKLAIRKNYVPFQTSSSYYDRIQAGQMLVVSPYLSTNSNTSTYFLSVTGNPGETVNLDSRIQEVTDIDFNTTVGTVSVPAAPYRVYRVQVPVQQIAWDVNVTPVNGDPNIAVRRDNAPGEYDNDAFSEAAGNTVDSITLVPTFLTDATWYITVYGASSYSFVLKNGPPAITPINYTDTKINDQISRAGWRFYALTDINSQLGSLGWELNLANQIPGSEIAIRRNMVPSRWQSRANGSTTITTTGAVDFSGTNGFLQRPGHQADIWYVGVYTPNQPLGAFSLKAAPILPEALSFNAGIQAVTGLEQGRWRYQRVDVPSGILGWDVRVRNVSGPVPYMVVRRDQLPATTTTSWTPNTPQTSTTWPTGQQWAGLVDWSGYTYDPASPSNVLAPPRLVSGMGRPLEPGTYYVGVYNSSTTSAINLAIDSRGIGAEQTYPITELAYNGGSDAITNLAPREAKYYKVTILPGTPSWELLLTPTVGEMNLVMRRGTIPDFTAAQKGDASIATGDLEVKMQKIGPEHYVMAPATGQSELPAGDYYLAVVSEGGSPAGTVIGSGASSGTLTSLGALAVKDIGVATNEGVTESVNLAGGQLKAYTFTVPENASFLEVRLDRIEGASVMRVYPGSNILQAPDGGVNYGADGGSTGFDCGTGNYSAFILTVVNGMPGRLGVSPGPWSVVVQAGKDTSSGYPDASATLTASIHEPVDLGFDNDSRFMESHPPGSWRYFKVIVPEGVTGWDVRLRDVTGPTPKMSIQRDLLPVSETTTWTPSTSTNWLSGQTWASSVDWTGCANNNDVLAPPRLVMGMGRPLQPGTYYVGICNDSLTTPVSYTIDSRGIGLNQTYTITDLAFAGGSDSISNLAPREAKYYKVTIPANTPSWEVTLSPSVGDMDLVVRRGTVPDFLALATGEAIKETNGIPSGDVEVQMKKTGPERYVMLPNLGQDFIPAGDYYIAAVSEGVDPSGSNIGTGTSSGTLTSLGTLAITDLGTATPKGIVQPVSLLGGQIKAYSFVVPAGTESLQLQLQTLTGTTQMRVYPGAAIPQPTDGSGNYGSDGGFSYFNVKPTYTASAPNAGVWTVVIQAGKNAQNAFPDSTANILITAVGPEPIDFNSGTESVTNQPAGLWRYFQVTVPAGAVGWDVRLRNVTGPVPNLVIRRDVVPITTTSNFTPSTSATWPTTQQWAGTVDWTGYTNDASSQPVPPRIVAGMGRPLEPGSYYIGVFNSGSTTAISYTIESRGIGTGYAYPVTELAYAGGSGNASDLPRREAKYFKVTIPANTPSWEVTLAPSAGEMELLVRRGTVPDFAATPSGEVNKESSGLPSGDLEVEMQKAGPERYVMLPSSGQDYLPAGDYYLAVVSEGVNPSGTIIGAGSSSGTLTSLGALAITDLGAANLNGLSQYGTFAGGQVKAFSFTVPAGAENLEVRLDTVTGSPKMRVYPGNRIPQPTDGASYGSDGGSLFNEVSPSYAATCPTAGVWTIVVQAGKDSQSKYPDASASISVKLKPNNPLNFAASLNTNGGTHTDTRQVNDGEYTVYKVEVPAELNAQPITGWVINTDVLQGAVSLQVYKNAADPASGITISGTDGSAVIVPPFLTLGDIWYVRVKATGWTNYTITSTPVTLQRSVWSMPGYPNITFGDTGNDNSGNPLPGDRGIDLAQGHWDFYAIDVPSGNSALLRTELQAISGNPDLYIREDGVPTTSHRTSGSGGSYLYQRSLIGTTSEYGNWVPLSGRTQNQLTPGRWYLGVKASGLSNARYRLIVSTGQVTDLDLQTGGVTNQLLADNDWRYYRFTVPEDAPNNWALTFSQQIGDVVMWLRDSVPPGQGLDNKTSNIVSWSSDNKNQGPYSSSGHDAAGAYTFTTPPLRPGQTYYAGFRSNNSATFSVSSATSGGSIGAIPVLDYYGGTVTATVPANGTLLYKIPVPAEGTRFKYSSTHLSSVSIRLEQGTLPGVSGSQHSISSGANFTFNQALSGTSWPWQPNQTYYMRVINTTSADQTVSVYLDGKNALTEDEDKDGLPDAWERQYFNNSLSYTGTGDQDNDGNSNATEYADKTNPMDAGSALYTLTVLSRNGTASQSLTQPKYAKGTLITLANTPDTGCQFLNWYGGPFRGSDIALKAVGTITLPTDGTWTFGINSDDGARLLINGVTVINDSSVHTAKDNFGQITLPAGDYALELVYFNRTQGASLELFAAPGSFSAFNNTFKLVGDTDHGGLAVYTTFSGLAMDGFTVRQVESLSSQITGLSAADSLLAGTYVARQNVTAICDVINFVTYAMNDGRFGNNVGFPITDTMRDNPLTFAINGNYTITALNSLPLETALNSQGLQWAAGDNAPWTGQATPTAFDGVNAAMSGPIGDGETSTIQTVVEGPGTLTFYWKVSSQSSDALRYLSDGVQLTTISGETGWLQRSYSIASGTHTVAWSYVKDSSGSAGSDCGWLDQVIFTPQRYALTINAPNGTVTANPQKSAYLPGEVVTLTATPASGNTFIGWSGDVAGTANSIQVTMNAARTVTANFGTSVAIATETEALNWTIGGSKAWFGETAVSYDGVDAAQSGAITHNQQTQTQITVTGPDTLRFWWKVSSEANADFLKFSLDGAEQFSISGAVDWQSKVVTIPAGTHTLTWTYIKNGSGSSGSDAGWLDQVTLDSLKFDNWATQMGLASPDALPDRDLDGDGLKNLAEFAFNLDPGKPGAPVMTPGSGLSGIPVIRVAGTGSNQHLQVEFICRKNAGLTYTVEFSTTLESASWQAATGAPIITPIDADWDRVIVEDTVNQGQVPRRFGRVLVSKP